MFSDGRIGQRFIYRRIRQRLWANWVEFMAELGRNLFMAELGRVYIEAELGRVYIEAELGRVLRPNWAWFLS